MMQTKCSRAANMPQRSSRSSLWWALDVARLMLLRAARSQIGLLVIPLHPYFRLGVKEALALFAGMSDASVYRLLVAQRSGDVGVRLLRHIAAEQAADADLDGVGVVAVARFGDQRHGLVRHEPAASANRLGAAEADADDHGVDGFHGLSPRALASASPALSSAASSSEFPILFLAQTSAA